MKITKFPRKDLTVGLRLYILTHNHIYKVTPQFNLSVLVWMINVFYMTRVKIFLLMIFGGGLFTVLLLNQLPC